MIPPMHDSESVALSRHTLENDVIRKMAEARDGSGRTLDKDQLLASRRSMVADDYQGPVWLFGYGSLMWNPIITIDRTRTGRIYGLHRRFCLKTRIGRGTPEIPGLVLGLDQGGSCQGAILRISGADPIGELDLLWKREMINNSYHPRWVRVHSGDGIINAITFVMNRGHTSYAGRLALEQEAMMIDTARGFIGPCREYFDRTLATLRQLQIHDPYMEALAGYLGPARS